MILCDVTSNRVPLGKLPLYLWCNCNLLVKYWFINAATVLDGSLNIIVLWWIHRKWIHNRNGKIWKLLSPFLYSVFWPTSILCICIRKRAPFVAAFTIKMAITVIDNNLTGSHFEWKNGILPRVYLPLHTNTCLDFVVLTDFLPENVEKIV